MAEMALNLPQIARQARTFFRGLSLKQRVMLGLSVVVVIGTLWLFVTLIERGQYQTLYSGLSPAEAQTIVQRLASLNIPSDIAPNGTLRVPASSIDRARLALAAEGLPQTGRQGFELFDKTNWAGSDFAEQVNYQRALEGELERTIESLSDVAAARVHLVMPHESLFTERQREAKAAVLVRLRGATALRAIDERHHLPRVERGRQSAARERNGGGRERLRTASPRRRPRSFAASG